MKKLTTAQKLSEQSKAIRKLKTDVKDLATIILKILERK